MTAEHAAVTEPIADAVHLMRVLCDSTRLRLLGLLQGGELNVTTLCKRLELPQPTVSHHLGLLRVAQLVVARRAGKQIFYSLNAAFVTNLDGCGGLTIRSSTVEVRLCDDRAGLLLKVETEAVPELVGA